MDEELRLHATTTFTSCHMHHRTLFRWFAFIYNHATLVAPPDPPWNIRGKRLAWDSACFNFWLPKLHRYCGAVIHLHVGDRCRGRAQSWTQIKVYVDLATLHIVGGDIWVLRPKVVCSTLFSHTYSGKADQTFLGRSPRGPENNLQRVKTRSE